MKPSRPILLLNRSCYPTCEVCDNFPANSPPFSQKFIERILDFLTFHKIDELYIGAEAFANESSLFGIIKSCSVRKIMPILLTRAQFPESTAQELSQRFRKLQNLGPYKILLVIDDPHLGSISETRLELLLKGIKNAFLVPEVLYVIPENSYLSQEFLDHDEVNKFIGISTRTGSDLLSFLTKSKHLIDVKLLENASSEMDEQGPITNFLGINKMPLISNSKPREDEDFPIHFNALVLETTNYCNARCSHCYTSCGPELSRERMPIPKVKQIIDQASLLPNLKKRCHVGGGEASIFWDEMIAILMHAKEKGFTNSIVTNGYWGRTLDTAMKKTLQLKEANVEDIEFSVDAMHQEYVSERVISNIIKSCKTVGIQVILRICTTKKSKASHILAQLSSEDQRDIIICSSKVSPIGRAEKAIPIDDMWLEPGIPIGSCHQVLNLTVTMNGDVFPCCAGSELCPSLKLGNCFSMSLAEIMKIQRGNFLIRTLIHAGPAYFAALLQEAGFGNKLQPSYTNYCHLCNHLFTDPEFPILIKRLVNKKVSDILLNADSLVAELTNKNNELFVHSKPGQN